MATVATYRLKFAYLAAIVLGSASFALLVLIPIWGDDLDHALTDAMFRVRGVRVPGEQIVIVGIDDSSFSNLQTRWPWPRDWHAELIEVLADARVIVFDILFDTRADADQRLAAAMRNHGGVILASARVVTEGADYQTETWLDPLPELAETAIGVASLELPVDTDGVVRRALHRIGRRTTLGYLAAQRYGGDAVTTDDITINYAGPGGTFRTFSYYDVLNRDPDSPASPFRDKLVLVGSSAQISSNPNRPDRFHTPYSRSGELMAGVEIHANVAANLIAGNALASAPPAATRLLGFLIAITLGLCSRWLKPWLGTLLTISVAMAGVVICYALFAGFDYLIPVASALLPVLLVLAATVAVHYYQMLQNEIRNRKLLAQSEQRIAAILAAQPASDPDTVEQPVKVFLSYSHKPDDTAYMAEIMDFVKGLHQEGIEFWTDNELVMGDLWDQQITEQLAGTDIALILISQSFLDSEYCAKEVSVFLDQDAVMVPVMLSPCDWHNHDWLSARQFLPGNGETLAEHYQDSGSRQRVLLQIRKDLSVQAERLRQANAAALPHAAQTPL